MAEYYETAIVPARVRAPQDMSLAESTVKFATTWIIAALRNQKFFSLEEVKAAVKEKLDELNNTPFKKREGSRFSAYTSWHRTNFIYPFTLTSIINYFTLIIYACNIYVFIPFIYFSNNNI